MQNGIRWWVWISGGLIAIGGFGAWATVFVVSVDGTQGDGWFVIVGGVVGGVLAYTARRSRWASVSALLAGVVGVAVTAHDFSHLESAINHSGPFAPVVHVGWGLIVALLASISMALAGLVGLAQGPEPVGVPAATQQPQTTYVPVPASRPLKVCPDCAEEVQQAARVCRFCGHQFADSPAADPLDVAVPQPPGDAAPDLT